MLAGFFSWWFAKLLELLPATWIGDAASLHHGIIIDIDGGNRITASVLQRNGRRATVTLEVAVRLAKRRAVLLRPLAGAVLVKHHTMPATSHRHLGQMLHFELERITPFRADEVFWCWDGQAKPENPTQTAVTVTMVPKTALAAASAVLDGVGLRVDAVVAGSAEQPRLLPVGDSKDRANGAVMVRALVLACGCLALVGLAVPACRQEIALHRAENDILALRPAVGEVEAFRRSVRAADARRDILTQEAARIGDVLHILATVTRLLPDDTFLTEFFLDERRVTISGRSASAARLVTTLSADPAIRDVAFAAPVTRVDGTTFELFSIRAGIAKP